MLNIRENFCFNSKRLKNQAQKVELVDPFDRELRAEKQLFVVQYIYCKWILISLEACATVCIIDHGLHDGVIGGPAL